MSPEKQRKESEKSGDEHSKADAQPPDMTRIEDLQCAISMLRIKMYSATSPVQTMQYYNQIKTLQDNIARLKSKNSSK